MKGTRVLAWALFTVWAAWLFALHGWLAGESALARWIPDLGLVLTLSVIARLEARNAPICAVLAALARASFGIEPPVVVLAGFFGVAALALTARSVVELSAPVWRGVVSGLLVLAFDAWLSFAHHVRLQETASDLPVRAFAAWPAASTSALLALAAGSGLAYLPGLTPLRSRRW